MENESDIAMDGFVEVENTEGEKRLFFPWDVVAIEPGSTPGAGVIRLQREGGSWTVGYQKSSAEEIRAKIWAAMQRGASAAVLGRMNDQGIRDVVEGLMQPVSADTLSQVNEAVAAAVTEAVPKVVTEYLKKLSAKDKKGPAARTT
jgi:hypothetical protein